MEITSIHKYISLNKLANGTTEVMFAGQPCIFISEVLSKQTWRINPVFAKLVYGANIFEDIPSCAQGFETSEEAIADALVKLHELGAFNCEVDLPEDTYAATVKQVSEEYKSYALKESNNIMEAQKMHAKYMQPIVEIAEDEDYAKWRAEVKAKHADKPIRFFGRIEQGLHTTSAEVPGKNNERSYGVYHHDSKQGHVFEDDQENKEELSEREMTDTEKEKREEIVQALKKDRKFISTYGKDSIYAVATARAKEVA